MWRIFIQHENVWIILEAIILLQYKMQLKVHIDKLILPNIHAFTGSYVTDWVICFEVALKRNQTAQCSWKIIRKIRECLEFMAMFLTLTDRQGTNSSSWLIEWIDKVEFIYMIGCVYVISSVWLILQMFMQTLWTN